MSGFGGSGFSGSGGFADDIISNIFNAFTGGGSSRRTYEREGDDIEIMLNLSFKEACFGVEKSVTFKRTEKCPSCGGTGAKNSNSIRTCPNCGGSGTVRVSQRTPFGIMQTQKTCNVCGGTGKIIDEKCSDCKGKGTIRKERTIKVKIPAGVDNGQMLTMRGEGSCSESKNGPNGNLIIVFKVENHPLFKRDGENISMELPITFVQATLGARIDIPTLQNPLPIDIPEGTQNGTIIRIKGKGIKNLKREAFGDLFVNIVVDIPKNLSHSQKKELKELQSTFEKARFDKIEKYNKLLQNL